MSSFLHHAREFFSSMVDALLNREPRKHASRCSASRSSQQRRIERQARLTASSKLDKPSNGIGKVYFEPTKPIAATQVKITPAQRVEYRRRMLTPSATQDEVPFPLYKPRCMVPVRSCLKHCKSRIFVNPAANLDFVPVPYTYPSISYIPSKASTKYHKAARLQAIGVHWPAAIAKIHWFTTPSPPPPPPAPSPPVAPAPVPVRKEEPHLMYKVPFFARHPEPPKTVHKPSHAFFLKHMSKIHASI
ncbi:hypothetical protein JCM10212_002713 [Sporobolomyces blumeae]